MDLDTFFTTLYVVIDDWYTKEMNARMKRHAGPALQLSDSEVLTIAIAAQWRVGVPWQSERGIVRYILQNGRSWFPGMLKRSQFNQRCGICGPLSCACSKSWDRYSAALLCTRWWIVRPCRTVVWGKPSVMIAIGLAAKRDVAVIMAAGSLVNNCCFVQQKAASSPAGWPGAPTLMIAG